MSSSKFSSVEFEVFGDVQGVFFRKCTEAEAKSSNCVGWVQNTFQGTVRGVVQGRHSDVEHMKHWLQNIGSPMSRIDSAKFTKERNLDTLEFDNFRVKH